MSTAGSITRESNGTWSFVVDLAEVNGKRRQLWRRGFPTKKATQAQMTAFLDDKNRGVVVAPSRVMFGSSSSTCGCPLDDRPYDLPPQPPMRA